MGRAFEYRKARKLKRWGSMSRTFTKIGKEITMAVKAGGPDPTANSRLRALMANAKAANMPKDTVERAIKKASDKDAGDYKEVIYEGFAPNGIAMIVETATDNTTRTVANLRNYFNKKGGNLGNSGTVALKYLEENNFEIKSSEFVYEPAEYKELSAEQRAEVEALIEVLEEDDDVQNVFSNMQAGDDDEE